MGFIIMSLERREKFFNSGRTISFTKKKISVNFGIDILSEFCSYVISTNRNIRKGQLINMRNLFDVLDMSIYSNDPDKMKMIRFITKGLEGRILHGLNTPALIAQYAFGSIADTEYLDLNSLEPINDSGVTWINQSVSTTLKYAFITNDIDKLIELGTRIKAADYTTIEGVVAEFENLINEIQAKFRKVKVESMSEMTFALKDGQFQESVSDIYDRVTNPSSILQTGMQGLNELLGGGFQGEREYMFLGLAGGGKSLTLLDIALQIKKYNRNYITKDPTKIPVVVYLTMENSVKESVQRMFQMVTGDNMENYSKDQVIDMMRSNGELYLSDDSPIDIIVKFVPNRTVDTSYLYTMCEDLEDEGYEVIAVIQDHIKRIRSIEPNKDVRIELGNVVNECKTFATIKQIPFITDSHLNRDAAKNIDEGASHGKSDLLRLVGRSNIGESMLMLDNVDGCFLLSQEFDSDGNRYMGLSRVKARYQASQRNIIYQPYTTPTSIKLVEDYHCKIALFRDTLRVQPLESELYNGNIKMSPYQNVGSIDDILQNTHKSSSISELDSEPNLFDQVKVTESAVAMNGLYQMMCMRQPIMQKIDNLQQIMVRVD